MASGSLVRYLTLGRTYSGKNEALDAGMAETSITWCLNCTLLARSSCELGDRNSILTTCVKVRIADALTRAASSRRSSMTYGTSLSSLLSSVKKGARASKTSSAFTFEDGREQLRILAHTRESIMTASPSSAYQCVRTSSRAQRQGNVMIVLRETHLPQLHCVSSQIHPAIGCCDLECGLQQGVCPIFAV
jgi:hypothetical protein